MRANPLRAAMALAFAALSFLALAQDAPNNTQSDPQKPRKDYALIFGTVWDKNDQPTYGIPVKIRRADHKKAQWTLVSDHHGEFAQRVPVGTADYVIWADVKVPRGSQKPETKAHIENNERVDVGLHLSK